MLPCTHLIPSAPSGASADVLCLVVFFFQAEDGIRARDVTGVQTCALPICFTIVRTDPPLMDAFDEYGVATFIVKQLNRAGAIGTCSEREKRAAMTDAEFWAHVYPQDEDPRVTLPGWGEGDQALGADLADDECPLCHAVGACGWDDEGRPLLHANPAERGSSSLPAVLPPLVTALLLVLSVAYREQVRTLVWLTPLALLLLAVVVGCVGVAGRLTARPPLTEHL